MRRKHHRPFQRIENTKEYKKELKERKKIEQENSKKSFFNFIYKLSQLDNKKNKLIFSNGMETFFKQNIELDTGKIHILRGDNGQGKSSLLRNFISSMGGNFIPNDDSRLKLLTNTKVLANALNPNLYLSPYKIEEDSMFNYNKLNFELFNLKNNFTMYMDFTISYFEEKGFSTMYENMNNLSNGERKIAGINSIFKYLKLFKDNLDLNLIENGLNIVICMDEPESGLSVDIQKEFYKRIEYYLKKLNNDKISLTFIIVSHSFIWKDTNYCLIHYINDFKKSENLKEFIQGFLYDTFYICIWNIKKGYSNHFYLEQGKFIDQGITNLKYPMIKMNYFPCLIDDNSNGLNIEGEIYEINDKILEKIDYLETHPTFFKRKKIDIILSDNNIIQCWCYFKQNLNYEDNMKLICKY